MILPSTLGNQGSNVLHFWDPKTLTELRRVSVHAADGRPVAKLNELEWIADEGLVLANVWYEKFVVAIDPVTGTVRRRDDFSKLLLPAETTGREDCLNGIALDPSSGDLIITGKWYQKLYRVRRER